MPTFNKSRGFKLKSGNKANAAFKMMGSSPVQQQADATLVTAATNAAMANVPKDLSAQFNETAKGAIAANKGRVDMLTTAAKEAPGVIIGATKAIKKGSAKIKARKDAGYKGVLGNKPANEADRANLLTKAGWKKGAVEQRKTNRLDRKEINKIAGEDFEKQWKIDKKSNPSDARKLTGVDQAGKEKTTSYTKQLKQLKAKLELEKLNAPVDKPVVTKEEE